MTQHSPSYLASLRQRLHIPLQVVKSFVEEFLAHDLTTKVAALTYTTVLAVVPLLALILALGRGFGLGKYIEVQLRNNINAPDNVIGQLMEFANSYIQRTQDDMIVGVSLGVLVFTLISLVNNIDQKFNALWRVKQVRSLFSFSLSYLGLIVFLVCSIFLLSGLWLAILRLLDFLPRYDVVEASMPVLIFGIKWGVASTVFAFMFKFIPICSVHWKSLWLPAGLTGALFCLLQSFYVQSQIFLSSYNAVYGSFAVLPLLMAWIYLTWMITLSGVLFCRILQDARLNGYLFFQQATLSRQSQDVIALHLLGCIARAFVEERPAYDLPRLAQEEHLPLCLAQQALSQLCAAGFVLPHTASEEAETTYLLNVDPHPLTAASVLARLDSLGENFVPATSHDTQPHADTAEPQCGNAWQQVQQVRAQWGILPSADCPLLDC